MAHKHKKDETAAKIKLKQPDRSGPSEKTLLELAQERDPFAQADQRLRRLGKEPPRSRAKDDDDGSHDDEEGDISPALARVLDTLLWTVSLAMLNVTLDVLVQNQFATEIVYSAIALRATQAFLIFGFLLYVLHPHASNPVLLPGLPARHQPALRQAVFFTMSLAAGCYLIHITNRHGYLAVMKRAPPVGCLWVWSVIELNLPWATLSLASTGAFLWLGEYSIK